MQNVHQGIVCKFCTFRHCSKAVHFLISLLMSIRLFKCVSLSPMWGYYWGKGYSVFKINWWEATIWDKQSKSPFLLIHHVVAPSLYDILFHFLIWQLQWRGLLIFGFFLACLCPKPSSCGIFQISVKYSVNIIQDEK